MTAMNQDPPAQVVVVAHPAALTPRRAPRLLQRYRFVIPVCRALNCYAESDVSVAARLSPSQASTRSARRTWLGHSNAQYLQLGLKRDPQGALVVVVLPAGLHAVEGNGGQRVEVQPERQGHPAVLSA